MNFEIDIFSPRWGHVDRYELEFSQGTMTFKQKSGARPAATLTDVPNGDPEWNDVDRIFSMLSNDSIYPPHVFPDLLERIWRAWRDHELSDDQTQSELIELANYVNDSTRAKPKSEFWTKYF